VLPFGVCFGHLGLDWFDSQRVGPAPSQRCSLLVMVRRQLEVVDDRDAFSQLNFHEDGQEYASAASTAGQYAGQAN
jgi:hypothetical protein